MANQLVPTVKKLYTKIILGGIFNFHRTRKKVAKKWLHGDGIEIGALHNPLITPEKAFVTYVDRMKKEDLWKHYPELADKHLVDVDIVDDGESLSTFENGSMGFIIANHLLEHCENPIQTLKRWSQVLKKNGIAYIAVPLKGYTFDYRRPVSSWEHVLKDYNEGPEQSREDHYNEWVTLVDGFSGSDVQKKVNELIQNKYSIHFHVYTSSSFKDFITRCINEINIPFLIAEFVRNSNEIIAVLKKI